MAYEISNFVNFKKSYSTVIIGTSPDKRCHLAGQIPDELTREVKSGFTKTRVSINFPNQQAAIDALLGLGITKFQLIDCSWYKSNEQV